MNAPRPELVSWEPSAEVSLRIPVAKLLPLFASGRLYAADFRCLDARSQETIRRLLLALCRC